MLESRDNCHRLSESGLQPIVEAAISLSQSYGMYILHAWISVLTNGVRPT